MKKVILTLGSVFVLLSAACPSENPEPTPAPPALGTLIVGNWYRVTGNIAQIDHVFNSDMTYFSAEYNSSGVYQVTETVPQKLTITVNNTPYGKMTKVYEVPTITSTNLAIKPYSVQYVFPTGQISGITYFQNLGHETYSRVQ
jgi:hypothetical protein